MEPSFIRLLPAIAGTFLSWNLHTPNKLLHELLSYYRQQEWNNVQKSISALEKHLSTFQTGDAEGRYWWECWVDFKKEMSRKPIQTNLFDL